MSKLKTKKASKKAKSKSKATAKSKTSTAKKVTKKKKSPAKSKADWTISHKGMDAVSIRDSFKSNLFHDLGKDRFSKTENDEYVALARTIQDRIVERWIHTKKQYREDNVKRVYYLSLEFLIGRLLADYAQNLDITEQTKEALSALGLSLEEIAEREKDAGLGNGGLGRLAACFLDSMATLGIPACGYGIRYDYGIFSQHIKNGYQVEQPDEWLSFGNPWEYQRAEYAVPIQFYGRTLMHRDSDGHLKVEWCDTQNVLAVPHDVPVPGYRNNVVNTLRLWAARSSEEFDLDYFNDGDYEKAVYNKMFSENISKVLYPNDSNAMGRELRLKQEYFFTAASIADIIRRFLETNKDITQIHKKVAIQLNDTHPALAVLEFLRVLIDVENVDWDKAWDVTVKTFAYTNHTVLPEALEKWSVSLFETLLPRHMELVYEVNARFLREVANKFPGDNERLKRMSIIEEGPVKRVRMATLSIVSSHSINGVSALHSDILKNDLFRDFYEMFPERFNNKTNGITPRRWLEKANPGLSSLLNETIGDKWARDLSELKRLEKYQSNASFQKKWQTVKYQNKVDFSNYILKSQDLKIDPQSIFDVQVKRIHEYKRQVLFGLYMLAEYVRIKENVSELSAPRTFIVGGKAAPGYAMAKLIIKFINSIAEVVNKDPQVNRHMKVLYLENYRVSLAEKVIPASDLSEQISTAGMEASGTGNMKFMLNGALTVGTLDGANIEMSEEAGLENMFIFGLKANEVSELKAAGYSPQDYINQSPLLTEIFTLIESNFLSPMVPGLFTPLLEGLKMVDPYLVCADFDAYVGTQQKITQNYLDQKDWTKKSILNVARAGKFSSDRTIREYAKDIWKVSTK